MASHEIQIADRRIGPGQPPYVVAEMSANHGRDFDRAVAIVRAAAEAGADAVKLQTYTPESLTIDCDRPCFQIQGTVWSGQTLHQLYTRAAMPYSWQPKLQQVAAELGLPLFSSPFDTAAVDFLEEMRVPAYKIASFELIDLPLLRRVGQTGKPVILSTGMATFDEIGEAVETVRGTGAEELLLLKCTSAYPATAEEMNLRTIPHLARAFDLPVGLSDHTREPAVPAAAVALGACLVEKHLTLDDAPGPDREFSLTPEEFRAMVRAVHTTHDALGEVRYGATGREAAERRLRRSLFAVADIGAGEAFTAENVRSIRPGDGLHPRYLDEVLHRTARVEVPRGTPLDWTLID